MPTTLPSRRKPTNRGEADDILLAQGQIAIIEALTARLERLGWTLGF